MYEPPPDASKLAIWGLSPKDVQSEDTHIWPDNVTAVNAFIAMSTQWRVAMGGPTGLDYSALPGTLKMIGIRKRDRTEIFEAIRVMESEALDAMQSKE